MSDVSLAISFAHDVSAPDIVRLTRIAEEAGFDQVWLPEDLFFRAPMPLAGALAVATERITIGFGVLTPYNRHPSLIAMELAGLLELAGPRVILGIGAGVAPRIARIGLAHREPVRAIADTVTIVRGLLRGEAVNYDGAVHRAVDLRLDVQPPAMVPPIYVAALGPRSLRQAGAIGDGLILGLMATRDFAAHATRAAQEGARAAGVDASRLAALVYLPIAIDADDRLARRRLKTEVAFYLQRWIDVPGLGDLFTRWGGLAPEEVADLARRLERGEPATTVIPDDLVDRYCLAGTPEACLRQIESYRGAGVTAAAIRIDGGTHDPDALIRDIAATRQGMPSVAGRRA